MRAAALFFFFLCLFACLLFLFRGVLGPDASMVGLVYLTRKRKRFLVLANCRGLAKPVGLKWVRSSKKVISDRPGPCSGWG